MFLVSADDVNHQGDYKNTFKHMVSSVLSRAECNVLDLTPRAKEKRRITKGGCLTLEADVHGSNRGQ